VKWEEALPFHGKIKRMSKKTAAALRQYFTKHPEQLEVANKHGNLPLHCVVGSHVGEHAVALATFLLNAYPDGARQKGNKERLPLHWATCGQKGEHGTTLVTLLLTAYLAGAQQKDRVGNLPAHYAERKGDLPASCVAMLRLAAEGKWQPPRPEGATDWCPQQFVFRSFMPIPFLSSLFFISYLCSSRR
jgi:hypothetical protein